MYSEQDQYIWCAVSFVYNKKPMTGFVRSDLTEGITINEALKNSSGNQSAQNQETENKTQEQNNQEQQMQNQCNN